MLRSEIDAIPLEGDVSLRQRAVELDETALLVIDLQKGEYNAEKIADFQVLSANTDNAYDNLLGESLIVGWNKEKAQRVKAPG